MQLDNAATIAAAALDDSSCCVASFEGARAHE